MAEFLPVGRRDGSALVGGSTLPTRASFLEGHEQTAIPHPTWSYWALSCYCPVRGDPRSEEVLVGLDFYLRPEVQLRESQPLL